MNKEETIEAIKVMQAYVDGKEIEFYCKELNKWLSVAGTPFWKWTKEQYRVKPTKMKTKSKDIKITAFLNGAYYSHYDVPFDSSHDKIKELCSEDLKEELELFDKKMVKIIYNPTKQEINFVSNEFH